MFFPSLETSAGDAPLPDLPWPFMEVPNFDSHGTASSFFGSFKGQSLLLLFSSFAFGIT